MSVASVIETAASTIGEHVRPIVGMPNDYDDLIEIVGDRRVVLIGEASHGTHEFYRERVRITRRLIDECGFRAVAVEGDWPDAYRVNRYVMGMSVDRDAVSSLGGFRRFPTWMWRNRDVLGFVQWLHERNERLEFPADKARFYGLDLYSLRSSIDEVIAYLDRVDPFEAVRARERYACFDHVGVEGDFYGRSVAFEGAAPCEDEVVAQLVELQRRAESYLSANGWIAEDEQFYAEQNARLVRDAEEYYHEMYRAEISSWNLRDEHMAGTLDALVAHLDRQFGETKVVVWEHNSHIGDARATAMNKRGEINVGQIARQHYGAEAALIGFTTFDGSVTAASHWGAPTERKRVRAARPDSHEALLHAVGSPAFWLKTADPAVREVLSQSRVERAIGVIYRPNTEFLSHYFQARLAGQFDVVIHIDRTHALEPLERTPLWDAGEPVETFPTGL